MEHSFDCKIALTNNYQIAVCCNYKKEKFYICWLQYLTGCFFVFFYLVLTNKYTV